MKPIFSLLRHVAVQPFTAARATAFRLRAATLLLVSAFQLFSFSALADTALSTNNVVFTFASFGLPADRVTSLTVQAQQWPLPAGNFYSRDPITRSRSNYPQITNGSVRLTNLVCGVPYKVTFATTWDTYTTNIFIPTTPAPVQTNLDGSVNAGFYQGIFVQGPNPFFAFSSLSGFLIATNYINLTNSQNITNITVQTNTFIAGTELVAGSNVTLSTNGNTITISSTGGAGGSATNAIGTITPTAGLAVALSTNGSGSITATLSLTGITNAILTNCSPTLSYIANQTAYIGTNMSATNLVGTLPMSVLPPIVNTNNASQLSSGTLPDARLSTNVVVNGGTWYAGTIRTRASTNHTGIDFQFGDAGNDAGGDASLSTGESLLGALGSFLTFGSAHLNVGGTAQISGGNDSIQNGPAVMTIGGGNGVAAAGSLLLEGGASDFGGQGASINIQGGSNTVDGKIVFTGKMNGNAIELTNTIPWTLLTSTNTPMVFNGTIQSFTVTNVALVLTNLTGANGSLSFRIRPVAPIPVTLPTVKWLAGSNSVMTNGILSLTSYGGTNDIVAAMKEGQ